MRILTFCVAALLQPWALPEATVARAADAPPLLATSPAADDVGIVAVQSVADIVVDPNDAAVVRLAATCLAQDIELVTGRKPTVRKDGGSSTAILVGTIGQSAAIDQLIADGKLDVSKVKGQWETFVIATVEKPMANIDRALVIAGSDRRGTAFGVFEISEQIGVSPWNFWADVPATKHDTLAIKAGTNIVGPPAVKYRGFFINDEDWGLTPWASKTFDPQLGNIGPKTYAKVFELMLRLKTNYLWPAMHHCSTEFASVPGNVEMADQWGIVMGASHPEPMNRNNVWWDSKVRGPWRYDTNRDNVIQYWREWAELRGKYEAVWTVGMRGIHDTGMSGPSDLKTRTNLLAQAIADQRDLLAKYVNPDVSKVPQAFVPYKEVLEQYQSGMELADDVTLVWCDDNYGYIRQLSNAAEQKRAGGSGVYYHASYLGWPHPYLWIDSTPPALIAQQMQTALATGADRIWVLNVGDIKSNETSVEFWARLAWKPDRYSSDPQNAFLGELITREFGPDQAAFTVQLLNDYYAFTTARKPELMRTNVFAPGEEANRRIGEARRLKLYVDKISDALPAERRDAFFELVGYRVRIAANLNLAYLYAEASDRAAAQHRVVANVYADRVKASLDEIHADTDRYNHDIAGGKWNGVVTLDGFSGMGHYGDWGIRWPTKWLKEREPVLPAGGEGKLAILIEGRATPIVDGKPAPIVEANLVWNVADESLVAPWQKIGDVACVPNTADNRQENEPKNALTHTFDVKIAGKYRLFAQIASPTDKDDSVFIRVDDGEWQTWNGIDRSNAPKWQLQSTYDLAAGKHTVAIAPREDGTGVRNVMLTRHAAPIVLADSSSAPSDILTLSASMGGCMGSFHVYRTDGKPVGDLTLDYDRDALRAARFDSLSSDVEQTFLVDIERIAETQTPRDLTIRVRAGDVSNSLQVRFVPLPEDGTFAEVDGVVSMEAEHPTREISSGNAKWSVAPRLGRSFDAMVVEPSIAPSVSDVTRLAKDSPSLEYDFTSPHTGEVTLLVYSLPGYALDNSRGLRYAVAIDDAAPQVIETVETGGGAGEHGDRWFTYKLQNIAETTSKHALTRPGKHTLRIWMVDANIAIDKLVLDLGGLRVTGLGPVETRYPLDPVR